MPAPRRSPAIDLGNIGSSIAKQGGKALNKALQWPLGDIADSVRKTNKKAAPFVLGAQEFMTGTRADWGPKRNLKGAGEFLAWGGAFSVGGKVVGKGVRKVSRAVTGSTATSRAAKQFSTRGAAKVITKAANKKRQSVDSRYAKVGAKKAAPKRKAGTVARSYR